MHVAFIHHLQVAWLESLVKFRFYCLLEHEFTVTLICLSELDYGRDHNNVLLSKEKVLVFTASNICDNLAIPMMRPLTA